MNQTTTLFFVERVRPSAVQPLWACAAVKVVLAVLLFAVAARNWAWSSQETAKDEMKIERKGSVIHVETEALSARIRTEGYVSGVAGGTLLDKKSGARDLGFGLDIVDFLLEPKWDEPGISPELRYLMDPMLHGNLPKKQVLWSMW